jgi:hypothetical protein
MKFLQPITAQRFEYLKTILRDELEAGDIEIWDFIFARYRIKRAGEMTQAQSCELLDHVASGRLKKDFAAWRERELFGA